VPVHIHHLLRRLQPCTCINDDIRTYSDAFATRR